MSSDINDEIELVPIEQLAPSPENPLIYRSTNPHENSIRSLADSIRKEGIREPLIATTDGFIVSGHRRLEAAKLAGLKTIPIRRMDGNRCDWTHDEYVKLLVEQNADQRVKTHDELLREQIVLTDPDNAYTELKQQRLQKSKIRVVTMVIRRAKKRHAISSAKNPMLRACQAVIETLREYWPLSIRQIHYALLNQPPLLHSSKRKKYCNVRACYQALVKLLTQARHAGLIPYDVIADVTRPVTTWSVYAGVQSYYRKQREEILTGYWRDLMQSQPHHIEIVAEKLTLNSIIEPVAMEFCIPLTIGRGQCSTSPLYWLSERFKKSGKDKLIILLLADLDPDGDAIVHSVASRLKYDFEIGNVQAVKVALTMPQVSELHLPPNDERAKKKSVNYARFIEAYGDDRVYELEAVPPPVLARLLRQAIKATIDVDAFNRELEAERVDAAHVHAVRARVVDVLKKVA